MKKIYVGNLAYQSTSEDLEGLFSPFGPITKVNIVRDRFTDRPKGFAFVEFDSQDAAQKALSLNGQVFQGRPLKIDLAKEGNREGGSGGGGSRSGGGGGRGGDRDGGGRRNDRGGDRGDRGSRW